MKERAWFVVGAAVVFSIALQDMTPTAAARRQDCYVPSSGLEPVQPTITLAQQNALDNAAAAIVKRLPDGTPSPNGKVIFPVIGPSNAAHVYGAFQPLAKPFLRPGTRMINTAQPNMAAAEWADPDCPCWDTFFAELTDKNYTAEQVGSLLLLLPTAYPTLPPAENAALYVERADAILDHVAEAMPNAETAYFFSNYYGACWAGTKTPLEHGYHEHLALQQIQDSRTTRPLVKVFSLYADGINPRVPDNLTMLQQDLSGDHVHLSSIGKPKYGQHITDVLRDESSAYHFLW